MSGNTPKETEFSENRNLISFPDGKSADKEELGVGFVLDTVNESCITDLTDPEAVNRELRDRVNYVKNQPLVKAMTEVDSAPVMDVLLTEIAEEISHLKWERRKIAKEGRSTAQCTMARISGLRSLADALLKRKEVSLAERLDLKSPRLQKIFKIWMQFFYDAMEKSEVPAEVINVVFQQMKADMQGWEKKMENE